MATEHKNVMAANEALKLVVPFCTFLEPGLQELQETEWCRSEEDTIPFRVFALFTRFVRQLWIYKNTQRWRHMLQCLSFGLVKDTECFGTTSVSMGIAEMRFAQICLCPLVIANCGTGGMKVGVYYRGMWGTYCMFDIKGGKEVPSPNALKWGTHYQPHGALGFQEDHERMTNMCFHIKQELNKRGFTSDQVEFVAFLTGPLREVYEKADAQSKEELNDMLDTYFADSLFQKAHSFLPQKTEGEMELLACESMYSNLQTASAANPIEIEVIASWGMGMGSTQVDECCIPFGGNNIEGVERGLEHHLEMIAQRLEQRFQTAPMNEHVEYVIALKSLFLNLMHSKKELMQKVLACAKTVDEDLSSNEGDDNNDDEGDHDDDDLIIMQYSERSMPLLTNAELGTVRQSTTQAERKENIHERTTTHTGAELADILERTTYAEAQLADIREKTAMIMDLLQQVTQQVQVLYASLLPPPSSP